MFIGRERSKTGARRRKENGGVELFVGSVEVEEEFKDLVDDFVAAGIGAVDLVDDDDGLQTELERALEHKTRLRHRAFVSVDQEQNAVDHFENAFHFTAEVGVARRVDDVELDAFVVDGGVFRENRDAAFALEVARVHNAVGNGLVLAERTALFEQLVDERGLAVVDVRDDSNISEVFANQDFRSLPK